MNRPHNANSPDVLLDPAADDSTLLALEVQFNEIIRDLLTARRANEMRAARSISRPYDDVADTKNVEAILKRLCPIERAIMQTPACTTAGLAVKARHAAYVLSHYWDVPIDQIDWDAQAVRLLVDAVRNFVKTPLFSHDLKGDE